MYYKRIMFYIIMFFTILFLSCKNSNNNLYKELTKLPNLKLNMVDYILIVPNQGCGGCITYAEEFYNKNKESDNLYFIFTQIASLKNIKSKLKLNSSNTYIDAKNSFVKFFPEDMKIYPCLIAIVNGKIKTITYNKPNQNVLQTIKNNK